jgi:heme/copper-type cytochrome/quinol oxidase subunit 2
MPIWLIVCIWIVIGYLAVALLVALMQLAIKFVTPRVFSEDDPPPKDNTELQIALSILLWPSLLKHLISPLE